jgi:hypothetical protein
MQQIPTLGYGTNGSIALIVRLGFGAAVALPLGTGPTDFHAELVEADETLAGAELVNP